MLFREGRNGVIDAERQQHEHDAVLGQKTSEEGGYSISGHHAPKISSSAWRITAGSGSIPVQYLMPRTPWFTSIPSPSMTLQPRSAASRTNRVRGGLGITSATIMAGRRDDRSMARRAFTSGNRPMEVALTITSVWAGTE